MKKYLCVDLGVKTMGVAKSDLLGICHPYEEFRFERGNFRAARKRIEAIVDETEIREVVIGMPYLLDRTEGERCTSCRLFGIELMTARPDIVVSFHDESFTTIEARDRLRDSGYKEDEIKKIIDMYSAVVILEDFLKTR